MSTRSARHCDMPRPSPPRSSAAEAAARASVAASRAAVRASAVASRADSVARADTAPRRADRKSTRLNSSHVAISYAVFCLKKKNVERTVDNDHDEVHDEAAEERGGDYDVLDAVGTEEAGRSERTDIGEPEEGGVMQTVG